jgi:hypothetical protein
MELPIDSEKLNFIVAGTPEPLVRFDTGEVVTNGQGLALYEIDLVFLGDGSSRICPVRTTTAPDGLAIGERVRLVDLVVSTWEMDEGFDLIAGSVESAVTEMAGLSSPEASR